MLGYLYPMDIGSFTQHHAISVQLILGSEKIINIVNEVVPIDFSEQKIKRHLTKYLKGLERIGIKYHLPNVIGPWTRKKWTSNSLQNVLTISLIDRLFKIDLGKIIFALTFSTTLILIVLKLLIGGWQ